MRNHYEGTPLDMAGLEFKDVGASFSNTPARTHPLTWSSGGNSYFNERPIATQQTGWNFVSQSRSWMPTELSGLLWFGVDDSSTTVRFPIYGCANEVPEAFGGEGAQDGVTPPVMTFDMKKAFSVFNLVANWAYSRW
jgi:dipeptidase